MDADRHDLAANLAEALRVLLAGPANLAEVSASGSLCHGCGTFWNRGAEHHHPFCPVTAARTALAAWNAAEDKA